MRKNSFKVIGISVRTTNKNNKSGRDLGNLWNRFFKENIINKIPNKESSEIFLIYTDYKSNYLDDYTAILGMRVSSIEDVPEGFVGREFEEENFQKFVAKGRIPEAIQKTWMNIWNDDSKLGRKYTYDFEVYGEKANNPEDAEVDIFVATEE